MLAIFGAVCNRGREALYWRCGTYVPSDESALLLTRFSARRTHGTLLNAGLRFSTPLARVAPAEHRSFKEK
jgi:hypothetical protein